MTDNIRTTAEIRDSLNVKFDESFVHNRDGTFSPYVCICCDMLLDRRSLSFVKRDVLIQNVDNLTPSDYNAVGNDILESEYKYPSKKPGYHPKMATMMLSPRASYFDDRKKKRVGFTCCTTCVLSLKKVDVPSFFAIVNNNYKGETPECLKRLTM